MARLRKNAQEQRLVIQAQRIKAEVEAWGKAVDARDGVEGEDGG